MKHFILFLALLSVAACSSGPKRRTAEDAARKAPVSEDSTRLVQILKVEADTLTLGTLDKAADTLTVAYNAEGDERFHGSATPGDTLALLLQNSDGTLLSAHNLSELIGLWLTPEGSGLRINADGTLATIGASALTLRSWHIFNGHLMFAVVAGDGSDYKERMEDIYIEKLTDTDLVIRIQSDVFAYKRNTALL